MAVRRVSPRCARQKLPHTGVYKTEVCREIPAAVHLWAVGPMKRLFVRFSRPSLIQQVIRNSAQLFHQWTARLHSGATFWACAVPVHNSVPCCLSLGASPLHSSHVCVTRLTSQRLPTVAQRAWGIHLTVSSWSGVTGTGPISSTPLPDFHTQIYAHVHHHLCINECRQNTVTCN